MKVKKLLYNWFVSSSDDGPGEDYMQAKVGSLLFGYNLAVISIKEHRAAREGDKWFYDILLENGTTIRNFNPNTVEYYQKEK